MFAVYSTLFGLSFVLLLRSLIRRDWEAVAAYFIFVAFSFIGICGQLWWSDITNRFGGAS